MIKTKEQLKQVLRQDFVYYHRNGRAKRLYDILLSRENTCIWRYVKTMRYCDYYATNKRKSIWHAFMYWWYSRKHNRQGVKLGLIIGSGAFDAGLCLYHTGNIVVNGYSRIGKNCRLHGSNCIGNSRGGGRLSYYWRQCTPRCWSESVWKNLHREQCYNRRRCGGDQELL